MRIPLALSTFALGACTHPGSPQSAAGASPLGLPPRQVSAAAVEEARRESAVRPDRESIGIPEVLGVPDDYRLIVLDGHWVLVRDAGRQEADPSLQPALLPQELAAEVASARESSARMESALRAVMQRSQELSDRAAELEAQAKRLSAQAVAPATPGQPPEPAAHPAAEDAQPTRPPDP
jgi:hypothetical protein